MSDNLVDLEDIQGFLIRGYNFRHVRYVTLNIKNVAGAQAFCAALLPGSGAPMNITNAGTWPGNNKPEYCLNIGFTYYGLEQLITKTNCTKVWSKSYELFDLFRNGATSDNNCKKIGDTDESAPKNWWKTGGWMLDTAPDSTGKDLHIQLTLFARDPDTREAYYQKLLGMIPVVDGAPSVVPAFLKDSDPVAEDPDVIHFGYKDSISQPRLDNVPILSVSDISESDDRPMVPVYRFIINGINVTPPPYNAHELLKNGSFAAFRLLYQNVEHFNAFIKSDPNVAPELVAAKMCGRWFNGEPLVVSPDGKSEGLSGNDNNNFNYLEHTDHQKGPRANDSSGQLCPYAAHIRRTNPRDDINVTGNDPVNEPLQARRILRRATPYGPPYVAGEPADVQRGLVGLFIGAKLKDQFQFIMNQWIEQGGFRNPDASPNKSGIDPLFGPQLSNTGPDNSTLEFRSEKNDGTYEKIGGLTRFIRTDGSMYLFLPGIKGLEWISKGSIPE